MAAGWSEQWGEWFDNKFFRFTPQANSQAWLCLQQVGGWCRAGGIEVPSPSGAPELGMKCQSTAAHLDLLSLNGQTLTAGTSPGSRHWKSPVGKAGQGHGKRASEDGQGCDASLWCEWGLSPGSHCPKTSAAHGHLLIDLALPAAGITPRCAGTDATSLGDGSLWAYKVPACDPLLLLSPIRRAAARGAAMLGDPAEATSAAPGPALGSAAQGRRGAPGWVQWRATKMIKGLEHLS